jgi:hypothetical protein
MNEREFTHLLVGLLRASIIYLEIETGKSIFYSVYIDESGNIPLHLNKQGEPMRVVGMAFEQDILFFEHVACQTSVIPRVAI